MSKKYAYVPVALIYKMRICCWLAVAVAVLVFIAYLVLLAAGIEDKKDDELTWRSARVSTARDSGFSHDEKPLLSFV